MTYVPTEILIVVGAATIVAIAIKLVSARNARHRQPPPHIHHALIERAESYATVSPFLRKICRDYRASGHISARQADAVAKAIAQIDAKRRPRSG